MKLFLGSDPGASGAYCLIDERGEWIRIYDYKNWLELSQTLTHEESENGAIALACLEKVGAMPGQGRSSMFSFGCNFGGWQAILTEKCIPFELITPQRWQKAILDSGRKKGEDIKEKVFQYAARRWPQAELCGKRGAKNYNRSDALCMAEFARRQFLGRYE